MSNSWFTKGLETHVETLPDRSSSGKDDSLWRFSLKPGENANVIFLDDTGFGLKEHTIFIDKKPHNVTCLSLVGKKCPICEANEKLPENEYSVAARSVVVYTVLDMTPWTNKSGKITPATKRLFVATEKTAKRLVGIRNTRVQLDVEDGIAAEASEGLKGHKYQVMRLEDKSPRVGDNFEHLKKEDLSKLLETNTDITEELLTPADYEAIFEPQSLEDVQKLADRFLASKGISDAPASSDSVSY